MVFKRIREKSYVIQCISLLLIFLVPSIGFPLSFGMASSAADSSRTAKVTKHRGKRLTIDKGWVEGVSVGMDGMFRFTDGSGQSKASGLFVVKWVGKHHAQVEPKSALPRGDDLNRAAGVLFKHGLTPRRIEDFPVVKKPVPQGTNTTAKERGSSEPGNDIKASNPVSGPNTSLEHYLNYQTVEYSGKGKQFRAASSYATAVEKRRREQLGRAEYSIWSEGQYIRSSDENKQTFRFGPHKVRRTLNNDRIAILTKGYTFAQEAINATMRQMRPGELNNGRGMKEITFESLGSFFPPRIVFNYEVCPHNDPGTGMGVSVIKFVSEPFGFTAITGKEGGAEHRNSGEAQGEFTGFAVYSPQLDRMYRVTSVFNASMGEEWFRVEECCYLTDKNGKGVIGFLDLRQELGLSTEPLLVENHTALPYWAVQAAMVQRTVCLSGLASAERGVNPGPVALLAATGVLGGMFDRSYYNDKNTGVYKGLNADAIAGGMKKNRAGQAVKAKAKAAKLVELPPRTLDEESLVRAGVHFSELLKNLSDISLAFTIGEFIADASDSLLATANLSILKLLNPQMSSNAASSLGGVGDNSASVARQAGGPGNLGNQNDLATKKGPSRSMGDKRTNRASETKPKQLNDGKSVQKEPSPRKNNGKNTKEKVKGKKRSKQRKKIKEKQKVKKSKVSKGSKAAKATGTTSTGGGAGLGSIVLGTAAVAGAVYGVYELVELLDPGITGDWTFYLSLGQYGTFPTPITLSGSKTKGTVDWGGGYTGPYRVDGDRISMRLNINFDFREFGYSGSMRIDENISGTIKDNNNMSGNYSILGRYYYGGYSFSYRFNGSWSATR